MSLVLPEQHQQFQHILRLLNTNVDGKRKIMYALTEIKGVGRRYSNIVCKKADVDLNKRYVPFVCALYLYVRLSDYLLISFFKLQKLYDLILDFIMDTTANLNLNMVGYEYSAGDLNSDELERIVTIMQNPAQYKIPTYFLNRQKDIIDGKNSQILSNAVDSKLRDDLERLKKIRAHRGLRHFWGLRVRGQHTKTTGTFFFHFSRFWLAYKGLCVILTEIMMLFYRSSW